MGPFRFTAFWLLLVLPNLIVANAQTTDSVAGVGTNGSETNLCNNAESLSGPTKAVCHGTINDPNGHYSGAGVSAAAASSSGVAIGGVVTVQRDDMGGLVEMADIAEATLSDSFTLGNTPTGSYFFVASSLSAVPGGTAQASIILQVDITNGINNGECVTESFGLSSCSTQMVLQQISPVYFTMFLGAVGSVSCGPPNCGGGSASFNAGIKSPGGGKVLVVKVLDSNGKPLNGATITAESGHQYPNYFASTVALTSRPNPANEGDLVTFTATVSSFGRADLPTGKVAFKDMTTGKTVQTTLEAGVATFSTSSLTAGTHTIKARYGGDDWSAASHAALIQVVN
jgi:hypothetical protein